MLETDIRAAGRRRARRPIATPRARRSRAARGAVGRHGARRRARCRRARSGWRVNTWVKQGILLGFRFGDIVDVSMDHGKLAVLRQGHAAAEEAGRRRRRAHRARRIGGPRRRVHRAAA